MRYRIEQKSAKEIAIIVDTSGKQFPRAATAAELEMWNLLLEVMQTLATSEGGIGEAVELVFYAPLREAEARVRQLEGEIERLRSTPAFADNVISAKDCL